MKIIKINYNDTKPFLIGIHYAHRMPCIQYAFGLICDDLLEGVVTYGQPASPYLCKGLAGENNRKRVIELNRLVVTTNKKNAASFLIGGSLKMLPKDLFVVSYADSQMGHIGYVYQATNWIYTGITKARTDIFSESGHSRHHCADVSKRQYRSAKHRYVTFTGSKKTMIKELRYPIAPYPKGETKRYFIQKHSDYKSQQTKLDLI